MLQALTKSEVVERIKGFDRRYVNDWDDWLRVSQDCNFQGAPIPISVAAKFGEIMRKWQACRPRGYRSDTELQRTLNAATGPLARMGPADLRCFLEHGEVLTGAICDLWRIFERGLCSNGNASEVGISKAILLATKGRIGPAFDSNVKRELLIRKRMDGRAYISALGQIAGELAVFEVREAATLEGLAEQAGRAAGVGRAVDMVLGPRGNLLRPIT